MPMAYIMLHLILIRCLQFLLDRALLLSVTHRVTAGLFTLCDCPGVAIDCTPHCNPLRAAP